MDRQKELAKDGLYINNDCKFVVANNYIHNVLWGNSEVYRPEGIRVIGGSGVIKNNFIKMEYGNFGRSRVGISAAIEIRDTIDVTILNNLFSGADTEIHAPFGVTTVMDILTVKRWR